MNDARRRRADLFVYLFSLDKISESDGPEK